MKFKHSTRSETLGFAPEGAVSVIGQVPRDKSVTGQRFQFVDA